ncbi:MAG TPA: FKBP-type peptidyl-prolyl cis-trans isomerase [Bacteroidia bacterium]|nr:FKBP-type peptidyl-prolyl cis-trans isomerase [Bacteroidia bacterium]
MNPLQLILFCLLTMGLGACENKDRQPQARSEKPDAEKDKMIREQFVRVNRQVAQKESDEMDYYAKSHQMPFIKTPSGIRYFVYKPSAKGDSVKKDMQITMNFQIKLLDGTECYSSATEGPKTFIVAHDDLESGIHKGVQYLKRGDKAIFLIPSVLAHGLLGDMKKIPPQMPIVYDVEIH